MIIHLARIWRRNNKLYSQLQMIKEEDNEYRQKLDKSIEYFLG
jgi:flagellar biosynthesis chaperone FliJ